MEPKPKITNMILVYLASIYYNPKQLKAEPISKKGCIRFGGMEMTGN